MADPAMRYGTAAGFAAVAAEAHRRRTTSVGAAAVALGLAVALGGTLNLPGGATSSDRLVPATPVPATASPSPAAPVPQPARPPAAAAGAPAADRPAAYRSAPAVGTTAAPPPAPASRPGRTAPQSARSTRYSHVAGIGGGCLPYPDVVGPCAYVASPGVSEKDVTLGASYCSDARGGSLRFAEDVEVEFWVTGADGATRWTSLRDYPPRPSPHSASLVQRTCVGWTTRWLRTANDGTRLPAGRYTLHARVRSPDATAVMEPVPFDLR